jgi:hypothetical protein
MKCPAAAGITEVPTRTRAARAAETGLDAAVRPVVRLDEKVVWDMWRSFASVANVRSHYGREAIPLMPLSRFSMLYRLDMSCLTPGSFAFENAQLKMRRAA